jgi:hypothetical protein
MCTTCVVVTWYSMPWPAEGAVTTALVTSGQVGREVEKLITKLLSVGALFLVPRTQV